MKTIVSALVALSVLAGIAAPASALDAKKFWDEHPTGSERYIRESMRGPSFDPHGKAPPLLPAGLFPFSPAAQDGKPTGLSG